MIVGSRGNVCTGTALARDLVLTAAHCVAPTATYRVLTPDLQPPGLPLLGVSVHPRYDEGHYQSGRVTADVALLKLERPLPDGIAPVGLAPDRRMLPGERLVIAGYGGTLPGRDVGLGVPRQATLIVTGRPGNLQIRLVDPATRDQRAGLGACTGDSGGPAFIASAGTYSVIGVVSWSTGPAGGEGCGGLTGITPLSLYRTWILDTARRMGSAIGR
jgi:secreted trypsin-like serine protease